MKIGKQEANYYSTIKHSFSGVRAIDGMLSPVDWKLEIDVVGSESDTTDEVTISVEKVINWLHNTLLFPVVVCPADDIMYRISNAVHNCPIHLPVTPTDDMLVQVLHRKIKVIAGKALHVGELRLDSNDASIKYSYGKLRSDKVYYTSGQYHQEELYHKDPWWERNDSHSFEYPITTEDSKEAYDEFFAEEVDPLVEVEQHIRASMSFDRNSDVDEIEEQEADIIQVNTWKKKQD